MTQDNLDFFCRSVQELKNLKDDLAVVIKRLETPTPAEVASASLRIWKDYKWAITFYDELVSDGRHYSDAIEDDAKVAQLAQESSFRRLLFYLTLRTMGRSSVAIGHKAQEWDHAYATQARHLAGQIALLSEVRDREEKATLSQVQGFNLFQGIYSISCSFGRAQLIEFCTQLADRDSQPIRPFTIGVFNVLDDQDSVNSSLKRGSCDVIITDPPYGFNTDDDLDGLAMLYTKSIEKMITALKDDGQLVLCLLDRSHTGRRSPYFTHKELITQQVLSLAENAHPKREVITPAYAVPRQKELFRPPYYWESERALRRAILHFRIRTRRE